MNTKIDLTIIDEDMRQCCYCIALELVGYRMLLCYMLQSVYSTITVHLTLCVNNPELKYLLEDQCLGTDKRLIQKNKHIYQNNEQAALSNNRRSLKLHMAPPIWVLSN